MHNIIALLIFISLTTGGCFVFEANTNKPKVISRDNNFITTEGWPGVVFKKNGKVIYEMIDSIRNDQRYDLWRYYNDNKLIREETDRNSDDLIDFIVSFDMENSFLNGIERDDNFDGTFDYILKYNGFRKWIECKDSDCDGTMDWEFNFKGPINLLDSLNIAAENIMNVKKTLPLKYWINILHDDDNDGVNDSLTTFVRGVEKTNKIKKQKRFSLFRKSSE